MSESLVALRARMARIARLSEVSHLLGWDQQTYMPRGASAARGEQFAAISEVVHGMFTSSETGALLEKSEAATAGQDPDADDVRMLARLRRDYDRATRLPSDFVAEVSRHGAHSHSVWLRARE